MGAVAAALVGAALIGGGTAMNANAASQKRKDLRMTLSDWLPNIPKYQQDYFDDLGKYLPTANRLSRDISTEQTKQALDLRELVFPGMRKMVDSSMATISPLLRGELPAGVMDAFTRAGGASTVGLGMGGTGFGALNTGLFGARGSLGAIQTGFGLLPALLATSPQVRNVDPMSFLGQLMTPQQRTATQLAVREQNIGIEKALAGMQTSGEVVGGTMNYIGGSLLGASGMGAGAGGFTGGWGSMGGGGSPYGNPTPGFQGMSGGSAFYNVPVSR